MPPQFGLGRRSSCRALMHTASCSARACLMRTCWRPPPPNSFHASPIWTRVPPLPSYSAHRAPRRPEGHTGATSSWCLLERRGGGGMGGRGRWHHSHIYLSDDKASGIGRQGDMHLTKWGPHVVLVNNERKMSRNLMCFSIG